MNGEVTTEKIEIDPLVNKLVKEKEVAFEFQQRRHSQWNENYELYRDFVKINRLTQRQSVNFPIMKETINTLLSSSDDLPDMIFNVLEKEEIAQKKDLFINECWKEDSNRLDFVGLDILDKKNVYLCGRSHKKLNFLDKKFYAEVLDNFDILVDPKVNPLDLETARFLVHIHIFRSLREILADEKYEQEGKNILKKHLDDQGGIITIEDTKEAHEAKQERLEDLGVENFDDFGASDVIVELNEHYTWIWSEKEKKFVRYLVIVAAENAVLYKKPLKEVLGVEFYPIETWADDVDISDYWSDGKADTVRTPNKVLNIWLSQLLENRTLRNYGMHWFDTSKKEFIPQEYEPKPFGMYPCPGDPNKLTKQVNIPDLSESLDEMMFIRDLIERVTATPDIEKGIEGKKKTLGEAQILTAKSRERQILISKAYRKSWKRFAEKWYKILDANTSAGDTFTLYKESVSGKMYEKKVKAEEWKTAKGVKVRVLSSAEQQQKNIEELNKWVGIKNQFPDNLKLQEVAQRKILGIAGVEDEEIKEIMSQEKPPEGVFPAGLTPTPPAPPAA